MKILEQNGHKYSREQFEGYKFRAIFKLSVDKDWRNDRNIAVYTDNPNRDEVYEVLLLKTTDEVRSFKAEHWTTKEQDDRDTLFIEETLKDI